MIFGDWFRLLPLSAGDWPFLFKETIREFSFTPAFHSGNYFALDFYYQSTAKILNSLSFSWPLIERLVWFWPFLILTVFSSWFLAKTLFPKEKIVQSFAPVVYLFNTYILMVVGGGQVGIGLAYAVGPLVLGLFIRLINNLSVGEAGLTSLRPIGQRDRIDGLKGPVLAGLALAIQVMFDPRIALMTMGAVGLYVVFSLQYLTLRKGMGLKVLLSTPFSLVVPTIIAVLLHSFWLLPTLFVKQAALLPGYQEAVGVEFLSFANFSDAISLLHPNWPENIFGKVYFMRPEFLALPILAFSSLLFINYSRVNGLTSWRARKSNNSLISSSLINNKIILYFSILALIGAFLAKGSNPPFGGVYLWLFENIPGMNLFRDPTKFYAWVALSYSILISYSVLMIYDKLRKIGAARSAMRYVPKLFLLLMACCLLVLVKPAVLGQLGGTFQSKELPPEYVDFKNFVHNQSEFFRIFWIPKRQRFGFWSKSHPGIDAEKFFTEDRCQESFCSLKGEIPGEWGQKCSPNDRCYVRELSYFLHSETAKVLSKMGVKYVVVPYDSQGEIFLAEWKSNFQQREEVEKFLDMIPWLNKIALVDKIAVYEVLEYKDNFWTENGESLAKSLESDTQKYLRVGGIISLMTFFLTLGILIHYRFKQENRVS